MAVAPTGAIYKALSFDNVSSRTYGVYITGQAVYNAPTRDVEMISIPGRNGAFALDKGRFENIEVSYPAGIFADNETDFAEAISDFRNFLCSRNGYVRLTDEYNPNEYRMAIYKSGLEVTPAQLKAGEFNIVFDCKPQRWLTSGETAVTIGEWGETETVSGDIVSVENPNGVLAVKSLEVDLEPIQSGSGTPSPTNVRPISGHTDVVVNRTGKNLCDTSTAEIGTAWNGASNSARARLVIPLVVGQIYTLKANGTSTLDTWYGIETDTIPPSSTGAVLSNPYTFTATTKYLSLGFNKTAIASTDIEALKLQLEYGSSATTYEAYEGDTYTTALGTTVYGGTRDATTGVLTVTHKLVTCDGSEQWGMVSSGYFTIAKSNHDATLSTTEAHSDTMICNRLPWLSTQPNTTESFNAVTHTVRVSMPSITSLANFKTYLGNNNLQFLLELATPQTYQLTAQQIELLTGDNSIWSSGGAITLEYGQNPSVLFNPTLFESGPMLEVEGYGTIELNGYEIELQNETLGDVLLWNSETLATKYYRRALVTKNFQSALLNNGDSFSMSALRWSGEQFWYAATESFVPSGNTATITTTGIANVTANATCTSSQQLDRSWKTIYSFDVSIPQRDYIFGTAKSEQLTINLSASVTDSSGTQTIDVVETVDVNYDGGNTVTIEWDNAYAASPNPLSIKMSIIVPEARGESSVSLLGHPTYIDCDLGAAYMIKSGDVISLNQYIDLGSELPTLAAGANEITFDNTVTELKIIPRWWKV